MHDADADTEIEDVEEIDVTESSSLICPFMIRVDTREQAPFRFGGIEADGGKGQLLIVPLATQEALKTGDYSIVGYEEQITIERKGISDWFGSIGQDRERFEREMVRMSQMEFAAVVIEGDWNELLLNTAHYSRMSPKACARTIASWASKYGVHFFPTMNRRHAELMTFQLLNQYWRHKQPIKRKTETPQHQQHQR